MLQQRFFIGALTIVAICFVFVPDGAAYWGFTDIELVSSSGNLAGFHFTAKDWWDMDFWNCLWEEWNPYTGDLFCAEWEFYSLDAAVDAYIGKPSGSSTFVGFGWGFGILYEVTPDEQGTWVAWSDHWGPQNIFKQDCFPDEFLGVSCDPLFFLFTWWIFLGVTADGADVPPLLTWIAFDPTEVQVPGCSAVRFNENVPAADLEWYLHEADVSGVVTGWPNGNQTCVPEGQEVSYGTYSVLRARNAAGGPWKFFAVGEVTVTFQPPVTVLQVLSNAAVVSSGQLLLITANPPNGFPAMPSLAARLVRPDGSPATSTSPVQWSISFHHFGPPGSPTQVGPTFSRQLAAGQQWDINAELSGAILGGDRITVSASYQAGAVSVLRDFVFRIGGQNPTEAQIKTFADNLTWSSPSFPGNPPWFLYQLIRQESLPDFAQFRPSDSMPVWGAPNGWGVMQIENAAYEELWNWTANVTRGHVILEEKKGAAYPFWNAQVSQWQQWNAANPGQEVGVAPTPHTVNNCTFGMDANGLPPTGMRYFADAIWIKQYNGASLGNYIVWDNVTDPNNPNWRFNPVNNLMRNYVSDVCGQIP